MWSLASSAISGTLGLKAHQPHHHTLNPNSECSDDDASSSSSSREEGLECPVCWESFNIVENVPYVLWCGHTLCKNCVLGLQWAVIKFPNLPLQLPLFISCPWCQLLSFRLVWKGTLKFPRKNFFLLWMVESMNGDRTKSHTALCGDQTGWPTPVVSHVRRALNSRVEQNPNPNPNAGHRHPNLLNVERLNSSLRKSLVFFVHLTAKFPLVLILLLIIVYVIPASAIILALYVLVTVLFALPSFLILYFAYPSLDWLVREIVT
ncbi:hypothetical protein AMTRI_Chr10g890 [Amborella trichopoda]|uniref:RING-type domain-containing protein n=1 Tax=Amborella trichopoda TaxID=13333 RepID=W1PRI1_AMBTC|nr:uncharacterized protein LOC18438487 [Amborella trichopoda]ERN10316.1 hypothetical protein AMTR_s00177p00067830 [Amborella trichopoda]|eukprot:XP_011625052.1 uncharacterized protein LOC18438487 [Amborella trichopoda]